MDNRHYVNFNDALVFDWQCLYKKFQRNNPYIKMSFIIIVSVYGLTMGVYEIIHSLLWFPVGCKENS